MRLKQILIGSLATGVGIFSLSNSRADWVEYDRVLLKRTPHYFFRVFSNGNSVVMNSHNSNYILNFKKNSEGKTIDYDEIKIPGILDPVPTPDGRYITVPTAGGHHIPLLGGMKFFLTYDLFQGKSHKILRDSKLSGADQSIGILKYDPATHTKTYRVVTESVFNKTTGVFLQEYQARMDDSAGKLPPVSSHERKVCPDISFSLPMLSKTGLLLGGRDPDSSDSKIMSLDIEGNCHVRRDLGRPTGRLDFSYDDRFVAFHAESEFDLPGLRPEKSIDSRSDVVRVTRLKRLSSKDLNLNVFTYNIESGEFEKVTHCRSSNCYYPGFTQNGDLVYLEQKKDSHQYFLVFLRNNGKPESSSLTLKN